MIKIFVGKVANQKKYQVCYLKMVKDEKLDWTFDVTTLKVFDSMDRANYYAKNKARKLKLPVDIW